jgi:hypothetical protein
MYVYVYKMKMDEYIIFKIIVGIITVFTISIVVNTKFLALL